MCEKIAEESFVQINKLKLDNKSLDTQNQAMIKEIRELTSRNRRQEDFIFTMQKKLDQALKENATLE